jgi:hypothetical protein
MQIAEVKASVALLQQQLEESKSREGQMRAHNKVRFYAIEPAHTNSFLDFARRTAQSAVVRRSA